MEKKRKTMFYILLGVAIILIGSHWEYEQLQEDKQAQIDCRLMDTEN